MSDKVVKSAKMEAGGDGKDPVFCDRCGRNATRLWEGGGGTEDKYWLELCEYCYDDLQDWLRGGY